MSKTKFRHLAWLAFLMLPTAVQAGDYLIASGDVLEVNVAGVPILHSRVTVDADGRISFPLIGEVDVAGLSLSQVRLELRALLLSRNVVRRPDIVVNVAEYRPVYVGGDVVRPGQYRYLPGMTVHDIVDIAGGYGLLELRGLAPLVEAAGARGDLGALAIDLAKQEVRAARLRAELANQTELTISDPSAATDPVTFANIVRAETEQLRLDDEVRKRYKEHTQSTLLDLRNLLGFLNQAKQRGEQTINLQTESVARARGLLQRGVATLVRVEDEQRSLALFLSQFVDLNLREAQTRRDNETLQREADAYEERRRAPLVAALGDAIVESGKLKYRLETAKQKLRYAGNARTTRADEAPQQTINRNVHGSKQRLAADEDTTLQPGDAVEITIPVARADVSDRLARRAEQP